MNTHSHILIIGGGLAGLTSAIHLKKLGFEVILIEKDKYPRHKVCGEYISNEILPYLNFLGVDVNALSPVQISRLSISTQKGNMIHAKLPLGGFGVSRYALDYFLWQKAMEVGVQCINDQVKGLQYQNDSFFVNTANNGSFSCTYVIGAYGKRSSLDRDLVRDFSYKKSPWLAIKAHYKTDFEKDLVALHNFRGGYCGLSMVEDNTVNTCYLVHYNSFKKFKDIGAFQNEIMCQNPHLKAFYKKAEPLFKEPLAISQVNFHKKKPVENHVIMVGDSAGLIHPLCGNGMAMAIQGARILCDLFASNLSRSEIEKLYIKKWNVAFSRRLYTGRILQKILLNQNLQEFSYRIATTIPSIVPKIIKQTHGEPLVC